MTVLFPPFHGDLAVEMGFERLAEVQAKKRAKKRGQDSFLRSTLRAVPGKES
jgi:hypothetical protein